MIIYILSIITGLFFLIWSADKFVEGASDIAKHYGLSPLIIGMVIVGFGTSAPEMVVSAISALQGSPGIALGNAYGSNITNIALILGLTALLMPISVHPQVLKKELPILAGVTFLTIVLLSNLKLSRIDAVILLVVFAALMLYSLRQGKGAPQDEQKQVTQTTSLKTSYLYLAGGLVLLIISSRLLVYGSVGIASSLGVPDIIIGLTVVAVGTSLPELASSIIAARKGEADIALGNILGSNLFNTLAVVGIAGCISPLDLDTDILYRDIGTMTVLTLLLFVFCYGLKKRGVINRLEGGFLLLCYIAYNTYLISGVI